MKRSRLSLTVFAGAATFCAALAMTPFIAEGRDNPSPTRGDAVDPQIADGSEQERLTARVIAGASTARATIASGWLCSASVRPIRSRW